MESLLLHHHLGLHFLLLEYKLLRRHLQRVVFREDSLELLDLLLLVHLDQNWKGKFLGLQVYLLRQLLHRHQILLLLLVVKFQQNYLEREW
jgi:hypothetical protein